MSDSEFVRRFQRSRNWKYYQRIMNALASSAERIPAQRLSFVAGCSQKKMYALLRDIKVYLKITDRVTIHNLPGEGYCLARLARQRLDEVGKSQLRGIAHLNSGDDTLRTIDKSDLTNADEMEAYGIYKAISGVSHVLSNMLPGLRRLMSPNAQRHEESLVEQVRTPVHLLGLANVYDDDDPIQ